MNDFRDSVIIILMTAVLTSYQILSSSSITSYQLTDEAIAIQLIADCELWDIQGSSQPTRTLVLACPRMDALRLWPLPVQKPWIEDSDEMPIFRDAINF